MKRCGRKKAVPACNQSSGRGRPHGMKQWERLAV
jgi:hypothetical protein